MTKRDDWMEEYVALRARVAELKSELGEARKVLTAYDEIVDALRAHVAELEVERSDAKAD